MRFRGILLTIVVLLVLALAVFNWGVLTTPAPLDLLFVTVEVPLGLTLLLAVLVLASLFFLGALVDRAGQLRQVTQLERQVDALRTRVDENRAAELVHLEERVSADLESLASRFDEAMAKANVPAERASAPAEGDADGDDAGAQALATFEARLLARLDDVERRVGLVRNELAADIAQSEDALMRRFDDPGRAEDDGDAGHDA